jgi:hypothetical protein
MDGCVFIKNIKQNKPKRHNNMMKQNNKKICRAHYSEKRIFENAKTQSKIMWYYYNMLLLR